MTPEQIRDAAVAAGATVLGEGPFHYLFSEEQLVLLLKHDVEQEEPLLALPPLPY